jgi:hexosaminidase
MVRYLPFSIWIFVSLLSWCCTQEKRTSFDFSDLKVVWELNSNFIKDQPQFTATFTFYNQGENTLTDQDWTLYFNQTNRKIVDNLSETAKVAQIVGDFYQLKPEKGFSLLPGDSITITYAGSAWLIKETDAPHGLYWSIRQTDSTTKQIPLTQFFIRPFVRKEQVLRHNGDRLPMWSPEEEYKQNAYLTLLPENELLPIIPTPKSINFKQGFFEWENNLTVYFEEGLNKEAIYLREKIKELYNINTNIALRKNNINAKQIILNFSKAIPESEAYTLDITPNNIIITAKNSIGVFYGIQSLISLFPSKYLDANGEKIQLAAVSIKDSPSLAYRGMHIDVGRNFQSVEAIKRLIDAMAFYKMNKLHFHLTEDEGWRLEIPGLPELTEVGAKRGHTLNSEQYLNPAYGSGHDPNDLKSFGNGYYTRGQFIELIQYAHDRHIEIIPEINIPGHARAAIKAMEARYRKFMLQHDEAKAEEYLLSDLEDKSVYKSVQDYPDNVLCICKESVYTFYSKVVKEIVAMFKEANVPLTTIHTGGDEVPKGVWEDSPICKQLMQQVPELNSISDLSTYFLERIYQILAQENLKMAGWEEIAMLTQGEGYIPHPKFIGKNVQPYVWQNLWGNQDLGNRLANAGYPIILCNVTHLYFDLAYNNDPREPGFYWGGFLDARKTYELLPFDVLKCTKKDAMGNTLHQDDYKNMQPLKKEAYGNILGIQGQIWGETTKGQNMLEYYYLPRMICLAERAWNPQPKWADGDEKILDVAWNQFANTIAQAELPLFSKVSGGYHYKIPTPGAIIKDGILYANLSLPGFDIRYTTNGEVPTNQSTRYTQPVPVNGKVKLCAFDKNGRSGYMVEF